MEPDNNNKNNSSTTNSSKNISQKVFGFKAINLKFRIVSGFVVIAASLLILGVVNFFSLSDMEDKFSFVVEHDAVVIENARQLEKLVVDMETGQRGFIITGKENFLDPYTNGIGSFDLLIDYEIELVSDNPSQVEKLNVIKQLVENWKEKAAIPEIELARKYHSSDAAGEIDGLPVRMQDVAFLLQKATGKNILDELRSKFKEFVDEELRLTELRSNSAYRTSTVTKFLSLIIILFGVIGALFIGFKLANSISDPILKLKKAAIKIAKGNLVDKVSLKRDDEIGSLAIQMELMRTNLLQNMSELRDYKYSMDQTAIVAVTDAKGNITYANDKFCEISKYSVDELVGQNHRIVNSGHHSKEFFKDMWAEIGKGKTFQGDIRNKAKDGSYYWVHNTIVPFMDEKGRPYQYVAIKRDITESKIFNITLENLVEELRTAKENQSRFLSNMSHEIRTPMNGIIGMTRLLRKSNLDKEQDKFGTAILTSANNLMVIIDEILDFSKIEAGKLTIEKIPFNIYDKSIVWNETLKINAEAKGVNFKLNIDEEVPKFLIGDPVRLTQIMYNLGGNAIKFAKEGTVDINIYVKDKKQNDITLQVDVIDNGIGIPEDKLESIFSSFSQASTSTTRNYGGTGLGLTITKELVELQNGKIWIKSEEGKGSTFSFILPYQVGSEITEEHKRDENITYKKLKNLSVLLVEDHDINQLLAITVIEGWGYKVDLAENGIVAVEKVKRNNYDVILMDIHMPKMDGYQATEQIRKELNNKTPIIALTASAQISENQRCFDVGMNDFISKPFDPDELLEKINSCVDKNRLLLDK